MISAAGRAVDLSVNIAGTRFKNPVWVGSSELTMTFGGICRCLRSGAGAVVAKSINESQAARDQLDIADYEFLGSNWQPVSPGEAGLSASLINRSGLAQTEPSSWIDMLTEAKAVADENGAVLIGSITVGDPEAAPELVAALSSATGHVEVNVGAPHAREVGRGLTQMTDSDELERFVRRLRAACSGLLLMKLADAGPLTLPLVAACRAGGADTVGLTGRQHGFMPDIHTLEPVLGSWGAYSSPLTLPSSLYTVSKAYGLAGGAIPLIGTNGARDGADIWRFVLSGATAVEVVTALWIKGPEYVATMLAELEDVIATSPLDSVHGAIGVAARKARTYAEIERGSVRPAAWATWTEAFRR